MAIQLRRGDRADLIPSRLLPGEFAICSDGTVVICHAPGQTKTLATREDIEDILNSNPEAYDALMELMRELQGTGNPVTNILASIQELRDTKADKTYVDQRIEAIGTVDLTEIENQLAQKADIAYVDAKSEAVKTVTGDKFTVDTIAAPIFVRKIQGNCRQASTPTAENPVPIQTVGNRIQTTLIAKSGAISPNIYLSIPIVLLDTSQEVLMSKWDSISMHDDRKWYYDCNSKKVIIDSSNSSNFTKYNSSDINWYCIYISSVASGIKNYAEFLSTIATYSDKVSDSETPNHSYCNDQFAFSVDTAIASTADAFRAYVNANPITIICQTSTTQSFELAQSTVDQLTNINSFDGTTQFQDSGYCLPIWTIDYAKNETGRNLLEIKKMLSK